MITRSWTQWVFSPPSTLLTTLLLRFLDQLDEGINLFMPRVFFFFAYFSGMARRVTSGQWV